MKPASIDLHYILQLPKIYMLVVPPEYEDENGHMNMRWYLAIYDNAGYPLVVSFGLTLDYYRAHNGGGFDLEHHIHYLNEVRIGDTVSVYFRLVGRSPKRVHYLMFLVNETRGALASIFECVNSYADMTTRRTAPFPPDIAARMDEVLAAHQALPWDAPTCGVMRA